jgi:membrane peptidoglycan carboxypeptidase
VVSSGTGKAAQVGGDEFIWGKTGTTENYGDAWFVGGNDDLTVAIWVGYADKLQPMEYEHAGSPVAGGTFPAEIWRTFTQYALAGREPEQFPSYSLSYASSRRVTWRDGRLQLDNGYCKETTLVAYFSGRGPRRTANCRPNEVDVPRVVGQPLAEAKARLAAQPLAASIVYKPAKPRQRLDLVVDQFPRRGHLSSFDTVTLVLAKPLHGVIPNVVGLTLGRARARLRSAGLLPNAPGDASATARVVGQWPRPRVAAAPKLRVTLAVKGD